MRIYIASSWRNQLAVEALTMILRERGHTVVSFVEQTLAAELVFDDTQWVWTNEGWAKFLFDTDGATSCDMLIYIGPAGKDAMAEVGAAWGYRKAKGTAIPYILGFYGKGEGVGLMQRMMSGGWYRNLNGLLSQVDFIAEEVFNEVITPERSVARAYGPSVAEQKE